MMAPSIVLLLIFLGTTLVIHRRFWMFVALILTEFPVRIISFREDFKKKTVKRVTLSLKVGR